jgi:hypothetical protein
MRAGRILGESLVSTALLGTTLIATGGPAAAASCTATALEAVVIRDRTSTSGTALAQLNKGESAPSPCQSYYGGSYTKCGVTSKRWVKVTKSGVTGYVVGTCVKTP